MLRLVLDTQIWLDWLVFDDPGVRDLRIAVEKGRAGIWLDAACDAELGRVLAYDLGKHSIAPAAQAAALAQARRIAQRLQTALSAAGRASPPRCPDVDDPIVLEAATAARTHLLRSQDRWPPAPYRCR